MLPSGPEDMGKLAPRSKRKASAPTSALAGAAGPALPAQGKLRWLSASVSLFCQVCGAMLPRGKFQVRIPCLFSYLAAPEVLGLR